MNRVEEELTDIEWRDVYFLENFGLHPHNVLEYFSLSVFWDKSCNNEILKMQTKFNEMETVDMDLRKMVGIEYELAFYNLHIFVIKKQYRRSPTEVTPLSIYYIVNGNIYQGPTLHSLIGNRLLTSLHHVTKAFGKVYQFVDFHPEKGHDWSTKSKSKEDLGGSPKNSDESSQTAAPVEEHSRWLQESQNFTVAVDHIIKELSHFS